MAFPGVLIAVTAIDGDVVVVLEAYSFVPCLAARVMGLFSAQSGRLSIRLHDTEQ